MERYKRPPTFIGLLIQTAIWIAVFGICFGFPWLILGGLAALPVLVAAYILRGILW